MTRAANLNGRALVVVAAIAACLAVAFGVWAFRRDSGSPQREPDPQPAASIVTVEVPPRTTSERNVSLSVAPPATEPPRTTAAEAVVQSPAEIAPLLELKVATRETLMPNSAAVPNIALAAGFGAPFDPTRPPLVEGRTGSDGLTTLAIPWSAVEAARAQGDALWLRIVEPGFQQRTRSRKLPDAPGPLELTVIAFRGCTVRGRVLDGAGSPVVAKVRTGQWMGDRGFGYGGMAETRADGWFELLPFRAGTFEVVADAGDSGTAALRDVQVSADRVNDPIELVVRGPGVIRGRVTDGARHAAAGIDLEVVAADYDRARSEPSPAINAAPGARRLGELELEGRGRVHVEMRTDANGMFEVRGLREDVYVVRATAEREPGAALTSAPVPSDGRPLELVIARPHIAVEIVDDNGAPWITPPPDPRKKRRSTPWSFGDAPPEALLAITPMVEDMHSTRWNEVWIETKDLGKGRHSADVAAGRDYWVGMFGVSQPWRPTRVTVPAGAGRVDVRIVAATPAPPGVLVVDPQKTTGEHLRRGFALRIEDPVSGFALVDRDEFYGETFPLRLELPEGEYRITVEGAPFVDNHHGTLVTPRAMGRWETLVRVTSAAETTVIPQIPAGARLRLKLTGEANAADRASVEEEYRGYSVGVENWREVYAARAALLLRVDGVRPVAVQFTEEWAGSSAAGTHLTRYLALGQEDVSEVLPAGRFTLEARLPGGRIARAPVVLVDGQTTEVALAFE